MFEDLEGSQDGLSFLFDSKPNLSASVIPHLLEGELVISYDSPNLLFLDWPNVQQVCDISPRHLVFTWVLQK